MFLFVWLFVFSCFGFFYLGFLGARLFFKHILSLDVILTKWFSGFSLMSFCILLISVSIV